MLYIGSVIGWRIYHLKYTAPGQKWGINKINFKLCLLPRTFIFYHDVSFIVMLSHSKWLNMVLQVKVMKCQFQVKPKLPGFYTVSNLTFYTHRGWQAWFSGRFWTWNSHFFVPNFKALSSFSREYIVAPSFDNLVLLCCYFRHPIGNIK